jgi:hypothetical protein
LVGKRRKGKGDGDDKHLVRRQAEQLHGRRRRKPRPTAPAPPRSAAAGRKVRGTPKPLHSSLKSTRFLARPVNFAAA